MSHRIITGDCLQLIRAVGPVDVCIFDPPYSEHVHANVKTGTLDSKKRKNGSHAVDLGFVAIGSDWMGQCADALAGTVRRWVLAFCDIESAHLWKGAFTSAGFDYVRTGAWIRKGVPQLTGDRPGNGLDAVVICHPKGKKHWNGGGCDAVFHHGTCHAHRPCGSNNTREHPTQKPLPLMVELVELFSDPGETILDPTCGSGATGVAAVRLGRNFVGIEQQEQWAKVAQERCDAEAHGSDVVSARAGQVPLFGEVT